ncbi:SNF2-related domain-containing protein, partial [Reticulomyxa filosa]
MQELVNNSVANFSSNNNNLWQSPFLGLNTLTEDGSNNNNNNNNNNNIVSTTLSSPNAIGKCMSVAIYNHIIGGLGPKRIVGDIHYNIYHSDHNSIWSCNAFDYCTLQ